MANSAASFFMGPSEYVQACNVAWTGAETLDRVQVYKLVKNSRGRSMLVQITIFEPSGLEEEDDEDGSSQ